MTSVILFYTFYKYAIIIMTGSFYFSSIKKQVFTKQTTKFKMLYGMFDIKLVQNKKLCKPAIDQRRLLINALSVRRRQNSGLFSIV